MAIAINSVLTGKFYESNVKGHSDEMVKAIVSIWQFSSGNQFQPLKPDIEVVKTVCRYAGLQGDEKVVMQEADQIVELINNKLSEE